MYRPVGDLLENTFCVCGWLAKAMNFSASALFGVPFTTAQYSGS